MKRYWKLLALALALLLLAACGGSAGETMGVNAMAQDAAPAEEPAMAEDWYDTGFYDDDAVMEEAEEAEYTGNTSDTAKSEGITEAPAVENLSEKIIYSAYAEVETTAFEDAVDEVYKLMEQYGAFLENSSVTGSNLNDSYYGTTSNRTADFTLRVPKDRYSAMTGALNQVGNVTYLSSSAENITARYTDTESQLKALNIQEERLLDILSKAETVEDMIELESRLSDIRYQKEWLNSQLKNWDNQVAYSTVTIHLREVKIYTPEPEPEPEGYWAQVGAGFMGTLKGLGEFFKDLFRALVTALPVLVILAVIVLVIVLIIRRSLKKQKAARAKAAEIRAKAEAQYRQEHVPPTPPADPASPASPEDGK